jgi:octaprenyl-diphosphate synthase
MTDLATTTPPRPSSDALQFIQAPVRDQLNRVVEEMREIVTADLPMIQEVVNHLLQVRGKMFRPTLALLASAADGRDDPRAVTVAASLEMMHVATLVHDDSVDQALVRRGMPTVHSVFNHRVSVIMGDFLYTRALMAMVRLGDIEFMRILTDVSNALSSGEMMQLGAIGRLDFTEAAYFRLIRSKTASLLAGACECGALCGAPRLREPLTRYGDRLGVAFQIADDVLDYTADAAVTGKPTGQDLREHQVTLPLILALPQLTPKARGRVEAFFATDEPDDTFVAEVIGIVDEAGGIVAARRQGERVVEEAEEALAQLPETPARAALAEAINYVIVRRR